jgi:hypothetical protein
MLAEEKSEVRKQGMIEAAFVGWQLIDSKKNFGEYLKSLGLGEEESPKAKKASREEDLEKYRRIVQRVRGQRKKEE